MPDIFILIFILGLGQFIYEGLRKKKLIESHKRKMKEFNMKSAGIQDTGRSNITDEEETKYGKIHEQREQ